MNWVIDNLDLIAQLTLVHLQQSIIAVIIGFALAIPLAAALP